MLHAKDYEIMITRDGDLFFALAASKENPENPIMVYDGGNHATFYRTSEDVVLLDYINKDIQKALKNSDYVTVMEIDKETEEVVRNYRARIKIFPKNPFTDGLK